MLYDVSFPVFFGVLQEGNSIPTLLKVSPLIRCMYRFVDMPPLGVACGTLSTPVFVKFGCALLGCATRVPREGTVQVH